MKAQVKAFLTIALIPIWALLGIFVSKFFFLVPVILIVGFLAAVMIKCFYEILVDIYNE